MLSRAALLPLVLLPRCSPPRLEQQPFVPALEAEWDAERTPRLPPDALVLEEEDPAVWNEETLEFNGLQTDPRTPPPLQAYLLSLRLPNGIYGHAFDGAGRSLAQFASSASLSGVPIVGDPRSNPSKSDRSAGMLLKRDRAGALPGGCGCGCLQEDDGDETEGQRSSA